MLPHPAASLAKAGQARDRAESANTHGRGGIGEAGGLGGALTGGPGGEEGAGEDISGASGIDCVDGEGGYGAAVDECATGAAFHHDQFGGQAAEGLFRAAGAGDEPGFLFVDEENIEVFEAGKYNLAPFSAGIPAGIHRRGGAGAAGGAQEAGGEGAESGNGEGIGQMEVGEAAHGDDLGEGFATGAGTVDESAGAVAADEGDGCGGGQLEAAYAGDIHAGRGEDGQQLVSFGVAADRAGEADLGAHAGQGVARIGAIATDTAGEALDPDGCIPADLFDGPSEQVENEIPGDENFHWRSLLLWT